MKIDAEFAVRACAVVAAASLLAAPYWQAIRGWLVKAAEAAKAHRTSIARVGAAALIVAAAWGKVPLPTLPTVGPKIVVKTPSDDMRHAVEPIAEALKSATMADRMLWAALWQKSARVVAEDNEGETQALTSTMSLRLFVVLCLDIGWHRIGEHSPGMYKGLREATEKTFAKVLGKEQETLDENARARAAEFFEAIAWAGLNAG